MSRLTTNHDEVADFAAIHGDEIMAEAGRERDSHGNWSEEDLAWLWAECTKRVTGNSPDIS